jgi:lipoprotein-anchoring transpeptidase ErfK/SrfK
MRKRIFWVFMIGIVVAFVSVVTIKGRHFSFLDRIKEIENSIYKKASSPDEQEREKAIEELEDFTTKFSNYGDVRKVWYTVANIYQEQGDLLKARDAYQRIIRNYPDSEFISEVQKKLWDLNIKILFSPLITEEDTVYEVKAGDNLDAISKKFNTTVDLIMRSNNLKNTYIKPGKRLKISTAKYSVVIDKSQNTLILKSNERVMKTYKVSTGKNNSTPVGTFKIATKLINPPWKGILPGDPRNILGSRWLGFAEPFRDYGIHGTTDPESIGKHVTEGCIRMFNKDVEELYTILPRGTEVLIIE